MLRENPHLSVLVAFATAFTIIIIGTAYSQIIELFPTGGGGYVVASHLISPTVGMISGCALRIDYVLTISLSISSGADAIFSFLPPTWMPARFWFAVGGVLLLTAMNMRGVKESVLPLIPIFLFFVASHVFAIAYAFLANAGHVVDVPQQTWGEAHKVASQTGLFGLLFVIMHAYSMGAGTYTGIEAVSNGLPILRDPKVRTGKRTMLYMGGSLIFMVIGLMFAYILTGATFVEGKTLNAVMLERISAAWNPQVGHTFVFLTLFSEGAILLVAAQTGFLDGPRVLSNMALDRWFPNRFAMLSDRLVTQNGVLLMGGAAMATIVLSNASVGYLLVLYSITVFITFSLSQFGMVRHWWKVR
ncbi:MAG: APC family permease, partial [Candidatus Hydrogenedentes bacterium]|nr:APC family permease [Candidatus Hydrogenedentota bacterium]